jgi:hypothetical protein
MKALRGFDFSAPVGMEDMRLGPSIEPGSETWSGWLRNRWRGFRCHFRSDICKSLKLGCIVDDDARSIELR